MFRISRAKPLDLAITLKLYRRVASALKEEGDHHYDCYLDEACIQKALDDGRLLILKENGRIIASSIIYHDVESAFFPSSHSLSKANNVLEIVGCGEEAIIAISTFAVDPAYWGKGYGQKLLSYIESNHPRTSFLLHIPADNQRAIRFYTKHDYAVYGPIAGLEDGAPENSLLLAKRFKRRGLASFSF